jgi:hypothetical protein
MICGTAGGSILRRRQIALDNTDGVHDNSAIHSSDKTPNLSKSTIHVYRLLRFRPLGP